jgi:hypothetical protein
MTEFHIGSQQAGTITNVGGDATISGQQGSFTAHDARVAIREVREALRASALDRAERERAEGDLDDVEQAVGRGDERAAESRLERLVVRLKDAGALAGAGAALLGPITRLAQSLGPAAARVLAMLPG